MPPTKIEQLIKVLQNPALYEHPTGCFEVFETHISWILLTGEYAYKFKKPVDVGFLDFSSLTKRHHYCLEELRLNRRLAPQLYLDVVSINGSMLKPSINGKGAIIEYAVKMRQFPQRDLLLNRVSAGSLRAEHIDRLARCIAEFHSRIAEKDNTAKFGSAEILHQPVMENFQQIKQFTDGCYELQLQQLEKWCNQQYEALYSSFQKRKKEGFIRECHGDLHLGNIVIYQQQVIPFDAIEFNENLRWIDIISEVAFLLMDLDYHQYPDFAFRFLNSWLEQTGDYQGLILLRYYLVYRAMVRAKVTAILLHQQERKTKDVQQQDEIAQYLHLASTYIKDPEPRLIICHGLSGSGKTYVSQTILETIQAIRLRSDVERKRLCGMAPEQSSDSLINSGIYTEDFNLKVYQRLHDMARAILKSGFSVIVDATFLECQQRALFKQLAATMNIPFYMIHCHADLATLRQRIMERKVLKQDASEADLEVLEYQLQHQQKLSAEEWTHCIDLDTASDEWRKQLKQRLNH